VACPMRNSAPSPLQGLTSVPYGICWRQSPPSVRGCICVCRFRYFRPLLSLLLASYTLECIVLQLDFAPSPTPTQGTT
jgi:hypothetical protein